MEVPRLGPIRVDYGIPLNADEDQGSGRLHLISGIRF
jgi:outer membrane protein assembly factor BamA